MQNRSVRTYWKLNETICLQYCEFKLSFSLISPGEVGYYLTRLHLFAVIYRYLYTCSSLSSLNSDIKDSSFVQFVSLCIMWKSITSLGFLFALIAGTVGLSIRNPSIDQGLQPYRLVHKFLLYMINVYSFHQGASGFESESFLKIGDGYYYFDRRTKMNWFQAYESCRRINSSLVTFETVEEYNNLQRLMELLNDELYYWTSGNDLGNQGQHMWLTSGQPIDIDIWAYNQPDNEDSREHCDAMNFRAKLDTKLGLNNAPCATLNNHICEAEQPYTVSFVVWEQKRVLLPKGF